MPGARTTAPFGGYPRHRTGERGSTILIVLALLSVLTLLAITLLYTSRLEEASSRNFAEGIQRNEAALTAAQEAAALAFGNLPRAAVSDFTLDHGVPDSAVATKQAGSQLVASAGNNVRPRSTRGEIQAGLNPGVRAGTSIVNISDLSGRINVNTADVETLDRFFATVAVAAGLTVNSTQVAQAIVDRRLGPDGAPGTVGIDDNESAPGSLSITTGDCPLFNNGLFSTNNLQVATPNATRLENGCFGNPPTRQQRTQALLTGLDEGDEFIADIRYPAFGDDRRIGRLAELLEIPGITPELLEVASPYLTTFSAAQEVRTVPGSSPAAPPLTLLDLNRACAQEIYDALVIEYGGLKDDNLLRQFAVNIVDWRDNDRTPTTLPNSNGNGFLIGLERVPVITEVYPDSITPDNQGDDGEFIEIYNPWPEPFNLNGWRLRVFPSGQVVDLSGLLPGGGLLIVTDDYRDDDGNSWSLVDIFGPGATFEGIPGRSLIEFRPLEIPQGPGRVRVVLEDRVGNLVDEFVYLALPGASNLISYQRVNPLVREASVARATPFARLPATPPTPETGTKLQNYPADSPFTNVLELFDVFAGWAGPNGEQGSRWQFPAIASPNSPFAFEQSLADDPAVMDARMVDLFTIENVSRPSFAAKSVSGPLLNPWEDAAAAGLLTGKGAFSAEALAWQRFVPRPAGLRHGLVNINTAPREVLNAVGLSPNQIDEILDRRDQAFADGLNGIGNGIVYNRLSDILVDDFLWGGSTLDYCPKLQVIAPIFNRLTVTSSAFLLEGTPLQAAESGLPANFGPRLEAWYAFDLTSPDLVHWRFVP